MEGLEQMLQDVQKALDVAKVQPGGGDYRE